MPELKTVTMYTTRPIRDGEQNGVEYFFVDRSYLEQCRKDGILIECRTYDTVYGPWSYFTADDGQIDLKTGNYLIMGTLESYGKMRAYPALYLCGGWIEAAAGSGTGTAADRA